MARNANRDGLVRLEARGRRLDLVTYVVAVAAFFAAAASPPAHAAHARHIGRIELDVLGLAATLEPLNPVVPKNVPSGVRVVVRAGAAALSAADVARLLQGPFSVQAVLAGPGLPGPVDLPLPGAAGSDPLLLPLPPLARGGDYTLSNIRLVGAGASLDATPSTIPVKVIDQILVTSVTTRALTLDEIRARGIVLDRDDYLGFEFTMGLALESQPVQLKFPVVFDRQGVAVPMPLVAPDDPARGSVRLPGTLVPMLLEPEVALPDGRRERRPLTLPSGEPVRIPSVMVIPGNIGYLKQFFSAMLYVANGAPGGSGLTVREVTGKIKLPKPPGPNETPPLSLAKTQTGPPTDTLPIRGLGPDGEPGTGDDPDTFGPGDKGQAEFLVRGDKEGFHRIDFDIQATLDGLVTGPVVVYGRASGGVLVRNPYFDVSFMVPSVVRRNEPFKVFVTVRNVSSGTIANNVTVALPQHLANAAVKPGTAASKTIATIRGGDAQTVDFEIVPSVTGQVVASYLKFEGGAASGSIRFTLGVDERRVPLSPDTLVLPAVVDSLDRNQPDNPEPYPVIPAAMRVLGQAWSIANAAPGTLPPDVARVAKSVVIKKALALAEAGLRCTLESPEPPTPPEEGFPAPCDEAALERALRDLLVDFHGGDPFDTAFDQLLRRTHAGRDFDTVLGRRLAEAVGSNLLGYEQDLAELLASGPDAVLFAVESPSGVPTDVQLVDGLGRRTFGRRNNGQVGADAVSAVLVPLGDPETAPILGYVAKPGAAPYVLDLKGSGQDFDVSVTLPAGDGRFRRVELRNVEGGPPARTRVVIDPARPDRVTVEEDADGDGVFETRRDESTSTVYVPGPRLLSATVVGPETVDGAAPFGFNVALLFDRVVSEASSKDVANYDVPNNRVRSARRQLSGRLVFGNLELPEGPYVPTSLRASNIRDARGNEGPSVNVALGSRLKAPGAIVSGRVFNADGTTPAGVKVVYSALVDWQECLETMPTGLAQMPLNAGGFYEFRYVYQHKCGGPFRMVTRDPASGAAREVTGFVRAPGEHIVLDIALLGRGSVQGHVHHGHGAPARGAVVVALSQHDPQGGGFGRTDENGYYRIEGVSVGAITVKAALGIGAGMQAGTITRAGAVETVNVTLDDGTVSASGTVLRPNNGDATVVPGVLVVYRVGGVPVEIDTSDSQGRFSFTGMPVGTFTITASTATGEKGSTPAMPALGGQQFEGLSLYLQPPTTQEYGTVQGTVRLPPVCTPGPCLPGQQGQPAAGVFVSVSGAGAGVFTGADGSYSLPRVPVRPTTQTISALTRDGLRKGSNTVLISAAGEIVNNVDIELSGLGKARFVVRDPQGQPLGGLSVGLVYGHCNDPCGCRFGTTVADGPDKGTVEFGNLPLGTITARVRFTRNGITDAVEGSVQLRIDGDDQTAVLKFGGTGRVTGKVVDPNGAGVHGARVHLVSNVFVYDQAEFACGLRPRKSHTTDSAPGQVPPVGTFAFENVLVGPVQLTASHVFLPTAVGAQGVLPRAGDERHFELRLVDTFAGVVKGTVFAPDGVTPAGAGIAVKFDGPLPNVAVHTDDDSRYEFAPILPAGSYLATVTDPVSGGAVQERLWLNRGEPLTRDFRLKGRGTVRVRVVDGADEPVEQAYVRLKETAFPGNAYEQVLTASADGWAEFPRVFEGPFSVEAVDVYARGGRATGDLPGPDEVVELTLRLTTTGTVTGRFLMPPDATPIPYGIVKLTAGGRVIGQASTAGPGDQVGRFRFDYVPAGPVRLDAQDPLTGRTGVAFGAVESEGDELALDVVAQGLGRVYGTVFSNGAAMPLARVEIVSGLYRVAVLADSNGAYEVRGVPVGRVVATASIQGTSHFLAGTASGELVGEGAELGLPVHLRASGEVTGQVLPAGDNGGAPPPSRVTVTVGGFGGGQVAVSTLPGGAFHVPVVPAGAAALTANVIGSSDFARATADVPAAGSVHVPLQLNGVGTIDGLAIQPAGVTLERWRVRVSNVHGQQFWRDLPTAGANVGRFTVREALAGDFSVSLEAVLPGGHSLYGTTSGALEPNTVAQPVVQLQDTGTVFGQVLRPQPEGPPVPAYGAELTLEHANVSIRAQAIGDGSFAIRGVPVSATAYTLKVADPVGGGVALVRQILVQSDGEQVNVGVIVLDNAPPTLTFVSPEDGTTRAALGGPLTLSLSDDASGVDTASLKVLYANGGQQSASDFTFAAGQATAALRADPLLVGLNTLTAVVKDLAGNETRTTITWQVTGATLNGYVEYADGSPAGGVSVKVGQLAPVVTDANGAYVKTGLRPGVYTVVATDVTGVTTAPLSWQVYDGEPTTAPTLTFPVIARLAGFVKRADGVTAAREGLTVSIPNQPATTTGPGGVFDLGHVAAGTHTVTAQDLDNGDIGRATANVTPGGPPVAVQLNGVGTATVKVAAFDGAPVAGANVTLASSAPLSGTRFSLGVPAEGVTFTRVLAGTLTATATYQGLTGQTTTLLVDGGAPTLTVTLPAAGRITGTVTDAVTGLGVPGASVALSLSKYDSTTTDPNGRFAFDGVPFGNFQLDATTAAGDRARKTGTLASTAPLDVPLPLNGLGDLTVTVQGAAGAAVPNAAVTVTSLTQWGTLRNGPATGPDGVSVVADVLAGAVTVKATHGGLQGTTPGAVTAGSANNNVTVVLQESGTITGIVSDPGAPAVAGVTVELGGPRFDITTSDADGEYRFDSVPLGTYTLTAKVNGRVRARVTGVTLGSNNQTLTKDLALIGAGTVQGQVTSPSSPLGVSGARVDLTSQAASPFGGVFSTTTGPGGQYEIAGVPVGQFDILASRPAFGERKQASGVVTQHQQVVPLDLHMQAETVQLPQQLWSANDFAWSVTTTGGAQYWPFEQSSPGLTLVRNGSAVPFVGPGSSAWVPTEEDKRELVIEQAGLAGLHVTRKVYVPSDGYFARWLEVLDNRGSEPVTVDVVLTSDLAASSVFANASGVPGGAGVADRWLALDDNDARDVYDSNPGSPGWAFGPFVLVGHGTGAERPPSEVTFDAAQARVTWRWNAVAIDPGASVAFLHLAARQTDRARALASAERLVELPPEALAGLSSQEAQAVQNFAVPTGLSSTLPALPPNDGIVEVRALGGDGVTPVPALQGYFRSRSPYLGRRVKLSPTSADGRALLQADLRVLYGGSVVVPRSDYDVTYVTQFTPAQSASAPGTFPATGTVDLTTSVGRTLAASSTHAQSARERAADADLATFWRANTGDAASPPYLGAPWYEVTLPADTTVREVRIRGRRDSDSSFHRARLEVRDAQGHVLWFQVLDLPPPPASRDADVLVAPADGGVAGARSARSVRSVRIVSLADASATPGLAEFQVLGEGLGTPTGRSAVDVVFTGRGVLDGRVLRADQSPVDNSRVTLSGSTLSMYVGADGKFVFPVVPPGDYTLSAAHPAGGSSVAEFVSVPADQKTTRNLIFPALGSVQVKVVTAANQAANSTLALAVAGVQRYGSTSTGGGGTYTYVDVPPGTYTLTVTDARNSAWVTTPAFVVAAGAATPVNVTLPALGKLDVRARVLGSGAALAGARVSWTADWLTTPKNPGVTNSSGQLIVNNVSGPNVVVRVSHPVFTQVFVELPAEMSEAGTTRVDADLPGTATISGSARARDGAALGSVSVSALDATQPVTLASVNANASGAFTLAVPAQPLRLRTATSQADFGFWSYSKGEVRPPAPAAGETLPFDALFAGGWLAAAGQRDLWELTAAANAPVSILHVGAARGTAAPALSNPYLEVYGPDGALVAQNDDISPTNRNARVSFVAGAAGRYTVVARAAGSETGAYRLASYNNDETHVFRLYSGGAVSGTVAREAGGPALAGWTVRLRRGVTLTATTATDAGGRYDLPLVGPGEYTVEVVDTADVVVGRASGSAPTGDERFTHVFALPLREQVTVTVRRGTLSLGAGITVALDSDHPTALPDDKSRVVTTNSAGQASSAVPVGAVSASAFDPETNTTATDSGSLVVGTPLALTLEFPDNGSSVRGVIRGGGGAVPLPGALVTLEGHATTATAADGTYRFNDVPLGSYTLVAAFGAAVNAVTVNVPGGTVFQDLNLAVAVLRGTVYDGSTPLPGARVETCSYDANWNWLCVDALTDGSGRYVFYGLPPWTYSWAYLYVFLPDDPDWVTYRYVQLPGPDNQIDVTLTLPSVRVRVFDASGQQPVPQASVQLLSGDTVIRSAQADAQGEVLFRSLREGRVVQAYAEDAQGAPCVSALTEIWGAGEYLLDVRLAQTGVIEVALRDDSEFLERDVTVTSLDGPALGASYSRKRRWTRSVTTSAAGPVSLRVPAGAYRVVYAGDDAGAGLLVGQAGVEGVLTPGTTAAAELQRGTHTLDNVPLGGPLGWHCLTQPEWDSSEAQTCGDTQAPWPLWTYAEDEAPVDAYPAVVAPELDGRGYGSFLVAGEQVRVRRHQYVPPSGAFVRTLTVLHNPTDAPLEVYTWSVLRLVNAEVVTTSSGDEIFDRTDSFAVLRDHDTGRDTAVVLGAALPASDAYFYSHELSSAHSVALEPHATRALLTFTAWQPSDSGGATPILALTRSLADLSHPESLAGLTDAQRNMIVNFPPPVPATGLSGTVRRAPEGTAVPDALVGVLQHDANAGEDVLVARDVADASGHFTVVGLEPGVATLVALDPLTNRPGRVVTTVDEGTVKLEAVSLVADAGTGTVAAEDVVSGGLSAGKQVLVFAHGYGRFWKGVITLDAQGRGEITGVPEGGVTLEWNGPGSPLGLTLDPGGRLEVQVAIDTDVPAPHSLGGGAGNVVFVQGNGSVTAADAYCDPVCSSAGWVSYHGSFPWFASVRLLSQREVETLEWSVVGLSIKRRVFVPASGSFVRIVDVFSNDSGSDISLGYFLNFDFSQMIAPWQPVATSSGDAEFSLEDDTAVFASSNPEASIVAVVLAGPNAVQRHDEMWFLGEDPGSYPPYVSTAWQALNVPAGGRVALMQFLVVRPAGDVAGAAALAESLRQLDNREVALAGLSPDERSWIVNFVVASPQTAGAPSRRPELHGGSPRPRRAPPGWPQREPPSGRRPRGVDPALPPPGLPSVRPSSSSGAHRRAE